MFKILRIKYSSSMINNSTRQIPKVLRIEPSSSCNFQCIHCPTGLNLNESLGIMSSETFNQIFEQIKNYKFDVIVLYHGGEPFLNRRFFEMAKKLKPLTKRLRTTTNGSLLDDEIIKQLIDMEFDEIDISLDGMSIEENNLIRIGSDYEKISKRIINLVKFRNVKNSKVPKITIANTQIPSNDDIEENAKVPHHMLETFKDIKDDIVFSPFYTIQWPGMPEKNYPMIKPKGNFCDHIVNTITIRWNGDVVPCCYDLINSMVMGNILTEKLPKIWNNSKYQKMRNDIENKNPPDLCKNCHVLYGFKKARTNKFTH